MPEEAGRRRTLWAALAGALAGGLAGFALPLTLHIAASAALAGSMAAVAAEDLERMRVPDTFNALAAAAGLVAALAEPGSAAGATAAFGGAALGAVLCGGALYLVREGFYRLRGFDGLGFGDVKLGATGGVWLGFELFPFAILLAAFGALAWLGARTWKDGGWAPDRRIPFAAFLAPAIWAVWYGARRLAFG
jgi:leader peptidase (prepilin peptidase)/N-methyltransferase